MSDIVTCNSVLYRDGFIKELRHLSACRRFLVLSKHMSKARIKNHINILHGIALLENKDFDKEVN